MVETKTPLVQAIETAIETEISRIKGEIASQAVEDFEKQVRKAVVAAVISVAQFYSTQIQGAELIIRVQLETDKK